MADEVDLLAEISDDPDDEESDYGRGYRDGLVNRDALLAALAEAQRERDELLASLTELAPSSLGAKLAEAQRREQLMRPVVEAAREANAKYGAMMPRFFAAAVDTYETQTGGTE